MPWHIVKKEGQYCVAKSGSQNPIKGGCHSKQAEAQAHMAALYANVKDAKKGK